MSTQPRAKSQSPLPRALGTAMLFSDVLQEAEPRLPPLSQFFLQVHT